MRVLLLTEFFRPVTGGSQIILSELCTRLPPDQLVVYTAAVPGDEAFDALQAYRIIRSKILSPVMAVMPELSTEERAIVRQTDFYSRWFGRSRLVRWLAYVRMVLDVIQTVRRERPDVILCGQPFLAGFAVRCHTCLSRRPYAVYTYGEELTMTLTDGRPLARRVIRWELQGAAAVFTISRFSRDQLLAYGVNPARIGVQAPAVSRAFFGPPQVEPAEMRRRLGLPGDARVLLTVARLAERKGIDVVIRALPEVLQAQPNTVYMVVGSGEDEARLRHLAAVHSVEPRVRFFGTHDHDELVNYYHTCDIFVMPNRTLLETAETEGFGIVFLEANACGKPVVGGRAGGAVEAVEDGVSGLLVEPTDVKAVAGAILRLLNDPPYARQLGANGRRRALEQFSWDRNAAEVWETLRLITGEARVASRGPQDAVYRTSDP